MLWPQHLLANCEGPRKVGDRLLIAQDLDPPLPNRTCSLSPHPALTESPTLFRWIWVVCQIRKSQSIVLSAMGLLVALGSGRELFSVERPKNRVDTYGFLFPYFANMTDMVHFHLLVAVADTAWHSQFVA